MAAVLPTCPHQVVSILWAEWAFCSVSPVLNTAGAQTLVGDSWASPSLSGGLDKDEI